VHQVQAVCTVQSSMYCMYMKSDALRSKIFSTKQSFGLNRNTIEPIVEEQ
jgi:hypothetical protein